MKPISWNDNNSSFLTTGAQQGNEDVHVNRFPTFDVAPSASRDLSKLQILRQQDTARTWRSLDDKRVCVLCGNEFRGRDIYLQTEHGHVSCLCPSAGCRGTLKHFVFPGNPLLDPRAWSDWMLALDGGDAMEGALGA